MNSYLQNKFIEEFMVNAQLDLYKLSLLLKEDNQFRIRQTIYDNSSFKNSKILEKNIQFRLSNKCSGDILKSASFLVFNSKDFVISREIYKLTKDNVSRENINFIGNSLIEVVILIFEEIKKIYNKYK